MGAGNSCNGAEGVLSRRSTLEDATLKIDIQINDLERKIAKAEADAKIWAAKADAEPSAKLRAVQLLKQKKMYAEQRDRLMGTHFNVQNARFQEEQAELTLLAAQAMRQGADKLRKQQELEMKLRQALLEKHTMQRQLRITAQEEAVCTTDAHLYHGATCGSIPTSQKIRTLLKLS